MMAGRAGGGCGRSRGSRYKGAGVGPRVTVNTRGALGSAGFGDEIRPEAPSHWAWGGPRSRSALLQPGAGTGEAVRLARAQPRWAKGGV